MILKPHRCDDTHTEDTQLKTTLLKHTLHTKQPRSAEGIDEWCANRHNLRCCHIVCQWPERQERKPSAARSLSSLYPSSGATIENDRRFLWAFPPNFCVQIVGFMHKTILVMKYEFFFFNINFVRRIFCGCRYLAIYAREAYRNACRDLFPRQVVKMIWSTLKLKYCDFFIMFSTRNVEIYKNPFIGARFVTCPQAGRRREPFQQTLLRYTNVSKNRNVR